MKISKVYYEELRSVCIDNKWTNKRIGAEVGDFGSFPEEGLMHAKEFVRVNLDKEVEVEDNKKYKKAFEKIRATVVNEVDKIEEDDIPF